MIVFILSCMPTLQCADLLYYRTHACTRIHWEQLVHFFGNSYRDILRSWKYSIFGQKTYHYDIIMNPQEEHDIIKSITEYWPEITRRSLILCNLEEIQSSFLRSSSSQSDKRSPLICCWWNVSEYCSKPIASRRRIICGG